MGSLLLILRFFHHYLTTGKKGIMYIDHGNVVLIRHSANAIA